MPDSHTTIETMKRINRRITVRRRDHETSSVSQFNAETTPNVTTAMVSVAFIIIDYMHRRNKSVMRMEMYAAESLPSRLQGEIREWNRNW